MLTAACIYFGIGAALMALALRATAEANRRGELTPGANVALMGLMVFAIWPAFIPAAIRGLRDGNRRRRLRRRGR